MADGLLGLGSGTSVSLSQDTLDQLREADDKAYLEPITADIEETEAEIEAVDEINVKLSEFLDIVDNFDLYSSEVNVFDEVTANTSGTSVSFDAADTSGLNEGTINVTVDQIATRDVYQSDIITDIEDTMDSGTLSVTIGDETYEFDTTGETYESLATTMSYKSSLDVALEQVGDEEYRLVIKSAQSGLENAISISQSGDLDLGYENEENHVLTAQNFEGTIDGIDYNLSSNKVTLDNGLIINAIETGDSSISIAKDDSYVLEQVQAMATSYNELIDLVNTYTIGDEDETATISDTSTLRTIVNDIKNMFYDSYGLDDEENALFYGLSFDSDGYMEIDTSEFSEALVNNYDDLKEVFTGYAEKEGIGTKLKTYLDDLDGIDGLMTAYEDRLDTYLDDLENDYDEQSEYLDEKYEQLATQYAEYTVLITQMENDFASLEAIINSDDD